MRKNTLFFSLFFLYANAAQSSCVTGNVPWGSFSSNSNISINSKIIGNHCIYSYQPGAGIFTESEILKKPSHGKLEILNIYSFKYTANQNFNGLDSYAFKICGEFRGKGCTTINIQAQISNNGNVIEIARESIGEKPKTEQKPLSESEKLKANEILKEKEIDRLAKLELEKQKRIEFEINRLAVLEIEKNKFKERAEEKARADASRLTSVESAIQKQKEEAEAKARTQRLVELENEIRKLRSESSISKPVQSRQESVKNEVDPLSAFEGTWVSVNPPVFYLIFNKVALGIRQVSLPNIGQANIRLSDGSQGSNFQISAINLNCYYFVTFTNNRQKMIMELKAGESLCLQSSILEKAE